MTGNLQTLRLLRRRRLSVFVFSCSLFMRKHTSVAEDVGPQSSSPGSQMLCCSLGSDVPHDDNSSSVCLPLIGGSPHDIIPALFFNKNSYAPEVICMRRIGLIKGLLLNSISSNTLWFLLFPLVLSCRIFFFLKVLRGLWQPG